MTRRKTSLVRVVRIERAILMVRGQRVMLDSDLAELYGVETKVLNRAVKRNKARFPVDFMFQLSVEETANLRCQIGTSRYGGRRYQPYVFTEQGVAMLSSVLRSQRAVRVNVEIMRAFVRLRRWLVTHEDWARRLDELEKKYDAQFRSVFEAIRQLMTPSGAPQKQIGFYGDRDSDDQNACLHRLPPANRQHPELRVSVRPGSDGDHLLRGNEMNATIILSRCRSDILVATGESGQECPSYGEDDELTEARR
jgi:hypothetical protein